MSLFLCACGYHANMSVNVEDAFVGTLFVKFGQNQLLHAEHYAILTADSDGCAVDPQKLQDNDNLLFEWLLLSITGQLAVWKQQCHTHVLRELIMYPFWFYYRYHLSITFSYQLLLS